MANYAGWEKYLFFKKEATWGTAVTPDVWLPYETFDVLAKPEFYAPSTFTGTRQRKHPNVPIRTPVNGQLSCDLYGYQVSSSAATKSIAQHLFETAFSGPASIDQDSHTMRVLDTNDTGKSFVGCRFDKLTISGSHDSGAIKATADIIAKQEVGGVAPPAYPSSTPHYKPFVFADATFSIDSSAVELRSFELTIENNLQAAFNNSQYISVLSQGERNVSFKFSLFKSGNTYDALRRALTTTNATAELVLKGRHDGSASNTYSQLTISVDLMQFAGSMDQVNRNELIQTDVDYVVLKPSSTDSDVDLTWGTA